jgi:predicted Zn-ribbon and HTH transcriptional regulator
MDHRYVISSWDNREDLDSLNHRHIELRLEIRELARFKSVVDDYRRLNQIAEELKRELEQIGNLAMIPGRCKLCRF